MLQLPGHHTQGKVMKVILAADAIVAPLTGIGRYAFELAQRLPEHPLIEQMRFFSYGRWLDQNDLARLAEARPRPAAAPAAPRPTLRSRLAGNRLAVRVYQALTPQLFGWRLRNEAGSLFHSPNYFLPPFPGRSVATIHDLSHVCLPQFHPAARVQYMNRALPDTLRRADFLITDAESVRREVIRHFDWPADRIAAVPLGVAPVFHPRQATDLGPVLHRYGLTGGGYTLCVGTIEPRKNLERLLCAYEALPAAMRQRWPLVLAGARGWQSEAIHDRIGKGAAAGWVRYLEYVSQDDLPFLYAGARLFAYPSLYEGFGLPPLEAMASGVPVVTSNVSSLPEVVGAAALMVDPLDVSALSAALARGLEDDGWRVSAAALGLARASALSWAACVDNTVAIYAKIFKQCR